MPISREDREVKLDLPNIQRFVYLFLVFMVAKFSNSFKYVACFIYLSILSGYAQNTIETFRGTEEKGMNLKIACAYD